jgi:NTE family protein
LISFKPRLYKKIIPFFLAFFFSFQIAQDCIYAADFNEDEFLTDILWNKYTGLNKDQRPKTALVLGGGGARGFAHLGVLKSFENENIPIDFAVGTSMGSIAGLFYCSGFQMDSAIKLAENFKWSSASNLNPLSLFSMLVSDSMLSNEELEIFLNKHIGNIEFSALEIPLICVAVDLNTGERILLREGNAAFAARASAAIPGIFKPVEYKQRFLVDGGLYENIPVDIARIFEPDIVIAVSVSADISKNSTDNIFLTLMQAIYIQGKVFDLKNLQDADIVISPDVGGISAIDLHRTEEAVKKGFYSAQNEMKNLKRFLINKPQKEFYFE